MMMMMMTIMMVTSYSSYKRYPDVRTQYRGKFPLFGPRPLVTMENEFLDPTQSKRTGDGTRYEFLRKSALMSVGMFEDAFSSKGNVSWTLNIYIYFFSFMYGTKFL